MATVVLADPAGYGRVVRDADGNVERVVETKTAGDATDEELAIQEINSSIFAFDGGALLSALETLRPDNAQGELYLPDVLPALRAAGHVVRRARARRSRRRARRQRPRPARAGPRDRPAAHP